MEEHDRVILENEPRLGAFEAKREDMGLFGLQNGDEEGR